MAHTAIYILVALLVLKANYIETAKIWVDTNDEKSAFATLGQFPYHVGLRNKNEEEIQLMCGGSIIGPRHVMTQALCISFLSQDFHVTAGCVDYLGEDCLTYEVEEVLLHPDYADVFTNNIAIIIVAEAFAMSKNVQTIDLARTRMDGKFTTNGSGWDFYTNALQWKEITTIKDEACLKVWDSKLPQNATSSAFVCTASESPFAIVGYWGGPLVVNGEQIGIVGTSDGKGMDIHMRTDYYLDFIDGIMDRDKVTTQPSSSVKTAPFLITCLMGIVLNCFYAL